MLGAPLSNVGGDDSSARGTSAWETPRRLAISS